MSTTTVTTTTILVGQLTLDMYDAPKQELVWRGSATKTLDPKAGQAGEEHKQIGRETAQELPAKTEELRTIFIFGTPRIRPAVPGGATDYEARLDETFS